MSKLRHINLHNVVHLTGLSDQRAVHFARALDNLIDSLMQDQRSEAVKFRVWRKRATFANFQPTEYNISIRAYQIIGNDGKLTTIVSADASETTGGGGKPRRGAFVYCYMGGAIEGGHEIVSVPLIYLLREHGTATSHHVLYEHGSVDYKVTAEDVFKNMSMRNGPVVPMPAAAHGSNGLIYVGITSRAWTTRYREHLYAAAKGSHLPFHRALRDRFATCNTRFHYVLGLFPTKDEAEDAEEDVVEHRSLIPKGLNAIPGGKAGLRFLASINALKPREYVDAENIEDKFANFIMGHPEALHNNSALARLWEDPALEKVDARGSRPEMTQFWSADENAARMITSRADRLSIAQIRNARYSAAMGLSVEEIANQIGARNNEIVARLLEGKTYGRVV